MLVVKDPSANCYGFDLRPVMSIAQTNREILEELANFTGIRYNLSRIHRPSLYRPAFMVQFQDWANCTKLVELLRPHVILKRRHFEVFIKMIELQRAVRWNGLLDQRTLLKLIDLCIELRRLNMRDPSKTMMRFEEARKIVLARSKQAGTIQAPSSTKVECNARTRQRASVQPYRFVFQSRPGAQGQKRGENAGRLPSTNRI